MHSVKSFLIRCAILLGTALLFGYFVFRIFSINFAPSVAVFSILLFLAEAHSLLLFFGLLYSLWPRPHKTYNTKNTNKNLQINMFITVAGEPIDVVKKTIFHAYTAAMQYQKTERPKHSVRVIVLNDGKAAKKEGWQLVEAYCRSLGVYHVARETNEGFKAGNINNGLRVFPAVDTQNTIDCFIDSDFCVKNNFLTEILKPLADESVDFVQTPQRYRNLNTWVAQAAGAHQIFFFDYICPAKGYENALFLCGTNYAIRRKALLEAGGVDNRFVTEDYATSIALHLQKKKGVFLPKVLALGLAPMNLKEYFNQQTRWCKGCLDANGKYFKQLFFGKLTLAQKFHYFLSSAYYLIGIRDLILVLAPLAYLFFGIPLVKANTMEYLMFIYIPFMLFNFTLVLLTMKSPLKSLVLNIVSFPIFANAFISCVIGRNLPFTITIKKYEKENPFRVYRIQLIVAILLVIGLIYSLTVNAPKDSYGRSINYFWAVYDALFLWIGFILVMKENYSWRFSWSAQFPKVTIPLFQYIQPRLMGIGVSIIFMIYVCFLYDFLIHSEYKTIVFAQDEQTIQQELIVPSMGVYYGYYLPKQNEHPQQVSTAVVPGEKTTLALYYQDWRDEQPFDTEFMNSVSAKGVVPVITWEPWNAKDLVDGEVVMQQEAYTPKRIANGEYDDFIRKWARQAAAYKKPYFLRFAHEMNGNWYPWGEIGENTPEDYKAMWMHVHRLFVEEKATNTIWVWAPNATDVYGETSSIASFYPGDEYVDWVAYSGFNWGNTEKTSWVSFRDLSAEVYTVLSQFDKPIMVAETSTVSMGSEKEKWFVDLAATLPQMPKIKAIVFYNADFKNNDFSLASGMNAEKTIQEVIVKNTYFLKKPFFYQRQINTPQYLSWNTLF